ncbi:MAG: thioredoxin domain-containing protein [Candidatus Microsaccharimonas sp.]|jgi:protein-disulfide isomerase
MNKIAWIIFGAAVVLLIGGLVVYSRITNPGVDIGSTNINAFIGASDQNGQIADHTIGSNDSKVVLIEYGDFQCPSCGSAHPQVKALTDEYGDKILFIFRNLPLTSIHPNARAAAGVAEAAGLQGKYWQMHDMIFENQDAWSSLDSTKRTEVFTTYAETLELNKDQFLADLNSESVKKKISFDESLFKETGFTKSTPTFVLDGTKVDDTVSSGLVQGDTTALKALIDKALNQ